MAIIVAASSTPSTPSITNDLELFVDINDNLRVKGIDSLGNVHNLSPSGLRDMNHVHNGGFMIQQRVQTGNLAIVGVSTTTRAGVVADRWAVTTGNATSTGWAQIDTSNANETNMYARYYGKVTQVTNAAKHILSQFIINRDMMHLRGRTVRLQVKVKRFVGSDQAIKLGLLQLNSSGTVDTCPAFISAIGADTVEPTWGANLVSIAPLSTGLPSGVTVVGNFVQITTSNAWQNLAGLFAVPSNAKNLIPVIIKDTAGGATDSIGYGEFGLYMGQEIRDWVEEPFNLQLAKCQAFFAKTFAYGTVPVQSAGINTGEAKGICGIAAAALGGRIYWRFPVKMWKTPVTVTGFNPAAANALMRGIVQAADYTPTAFTAQLDESVSIAATSPASSTVGQDVGIHITVDAETVN